MKECTETLIDLNSLSKAARLAIPEEDYPRLREDLEQIASFMHNLESLPLEGVPPSYHPVLSPSQVYEAREDVPEEALPQALVLSESHEHDGDSIIVPKVME